jgi:hypothetical protein
VTQERRIEIAIISFLAGIFLVEILLVIIALLLL